MNENTETITSNRKTTMFTVTVSMVAIIGVMSSIVLWVKLKKAEDFIKTESIKFAMYIEGNTEQNKEVIIPKISGDFIGAVIAINNGGVTIKGLPAKDMLSNNGTLNPQYKTVNIVFNKETVFDGTEREAIKVNDILGIFSDQNAILTATNVNAIKVVAMPELRAL